MTRTQLFYADTSSLMHARQYLASKHIAKIHYPQGVRTGARIIEALEMCREKNDRILVKTSRLASFEMNQRYRQWIAKGILLELNLPLETIDGRDQDLFGSLNAMPSDVQQKFKDRMEESVSWPQTWEYRDVVDFQRPDAAMFDIADPMQLWEAHITLVDSLHLAMALALGANYFVSGDGKLIKYANNIAGILAQIGTLPTGVPYDPPLQAITAPEFFDTVQKL